MDKDSKERDPQELDPQELDPRPPGTITRRRFLTSIGSGTVAAAAAGPLIGAATAEAAPAAATAESGEMVQATLTINGRRHQLLVEPRWSLLHGLREELGLTGTKVGCERGECGSCTVLIDGVPRYACLTLALEATGKEITTLEGLMDGEELGEVQRAFVEQDAFQCGYCTPGQIMSVEGLLRANPDPSIDDIRQAVSGNLCRCGAYTHIFKAARLAADRKLGR
jgi:xanthine dehydrogenase YagT iron-sulfur-binding subunit